MNEAADAPTPSEARQISEKFLLGDLIRVFMTEFKSMPPVSFGMLPEAEQKKIIDRVTQALTEAVRETVQIIAATGRPAVQADIESVLFKDGIKVVLKMSKHMADRHHIADAEGQGVMLVLPMYEQHLGGDMPKADPDQLSFNE